MSDDPNLTSIIKLAAANRPFSVPYPYQTNNAILGSPFHVEEVISGHPFDGQSALDLSLALKPLHKYAVASGKEVWTEVRTANSSGVSQHLGVSGGAGVGCACFNASAVVNYDSTTTEDKNSIKVSRRMRRVDSVAQLRNPPHLTPEARHTLRYDGEDTFYAKYGSYYVGGLVLGAEGAVCFESTQHASSETQVFSLTVKVEFLFWSAEHTEDLGTFARAHSDSEFFFSAFESLGPSNIAQQPIGSSGDQAAFKDKINGLSKRLEEIKQTCGENVSELVKQHAVLELLLIPYSQLRQFVELRMLYERDAQRPKEQ